MIYRMILILLCFVQTLVFAETKMVTLGEKISFKAGDIIKLKDSEFVVNISASKGSSCAVPGFNCGAGYIPPAPVFKTSCEKGSHCPYVIMSDIKDASSGSLSIENEVSCEKNQPESCYYQLSRNFQSDEGCMKISSPMGQYYCLQGFPKSVREQNKKLCEKLPTSVFGLKWNCFYEYAIRYHDPSFCEKYGDDISGRDRCFFKMAELLKDPTLCRKISYSKENSYQELCQALNK